MSRIMKTRVSSICCTFATVLTSSSSSFLFSSSAAAFINVSSRQPIKRRTTTAFLTTRSTLFHTPYIKRSFTTLKQHSKEGEEEDTRVLGVCGGIGSGKSFICDLLVQELGCAAHIDADSVAHQVYAPRSPVLQEIASEFGSSVLQKDGTEIDRKELGSIVFQDSSAMSKLEKIVWPHAKQLVQNEISNIKTQIKQQQNQKQSPSDNTSYSPSSIIILEAAVLLDAKWDDLCSSIWIVTTTPSVAIQRLMTNRNMTKEDAITRISAQESRRGLGSDGSITNPWKELKDEGSAVSAIVENNGDSKEDLIGVLKQMIVDGTNWRDGIAPQG